MTSEHLFTSFSFLAGYVFNLLYISIKWSDCHKMINEYIDWTLGLKCGHQFLPETSLGLGVLPLPASVCVCVCINPKLVRAKTHHHLFKLKSPNSEKKMQKTLFNTSINFGIEWPCPSRSSLTYKNQNLCYFELVHTIIHHLPPVLVRISKFGPKIHLSTVKIPINFRLDWLWFSGSIFNFETYFSTKLIYTVFLNI